jgi:hypothetical protein
MQYRAGSVCWGRYHVEALPAVRRGADLARLNHVEQASNRLEHLTKSRLCAHRYLAISFQVRIEVHWI